LQETLVVHDTSVRALLLIVPETDLGLVPTHGQGSRLGELLVCCGIANQFGKARTDFRPFVISKTNRT
jgi:hypothetical protein